MKRKILLYSRGNDGHRAEYNSLLLREFETLGFEVRIIERLTFSLLRKDIFFAFIDEDFIAFLICSVASLLTGRLIGGFLFRAGECLRRDHWKYRLKYALFWLLKKIPTVTILSIMPFAANRRFAEVANNWVYDPQIWDLRAPIDKTGIIETELSEMIRSEAAGRKIVVALGGQSEAKGFNAFSELWCSDNELHENFVFVAAGKVDEKCRPWAVNLEKSKGILIDRYITNEELLSLYGCANAVWSAYAPIYDQASGVAGRALQFGVPVLLREGSFISNIIGSLDKRAAIIVRFESPLDTIGKLNNMESGTRDVADFMAFRQHFCTLLLTAMKNGRSE